MVAVRNLSYKDGLALLQGKSTRAVDGIDKILGGLIIASSLAVGPSVLPLIGVKNELKKVVEEPVANLAAKLRGLAISERSKRIEAANTVILVSSLLSATRDIVGDGWDNLKVTNEEVSRLLGINGADKIDGNLADISQFIANAEVPLPEPVRPFSDTLDDIRKFAAEYAARLLHFTRGLQLRDSLGASQKVEFDNRISTILPDKVTEIYQQSIFRLAGEVSELAIWLDLREHEASREIVKQQVITLRESVQNQLGETNSLLNRLGDILSRMEQAGVSTASRWLSLLSTRYEAELKRPLLENFERDETCLIVPTIVDTYVDPAYKIAVKGDGLGAPGSEDWWSTLEPRSDILSVMTGYLSSPRSLEVPLLILGHPGAGKSTIAKVLVSELGKSGMLPIYVPLRNVTATASISSQIGEALFVALQERVSWPDMLASAPDSHPVLILDGFDELVQATGASQSHYLELVSEFQETSKLLGREISVIVTSRTVVADRARIPRGSVVIKLEPFNEARIKRWVSKWNSINESAFAANNIRPLDTHKVLRYMELSSHPVLLLMLALYDSDGNSLSKEGHNLVGAALYERLFLRFVKREVLKTVSGRQLDPEAIQSKVEEEMYYLAIVALGMFNRGRQVVQEGELESDLAVLVGGKLSADSHDLNAKISRAQRLVDSFYFVNKSEASSIEISRDSTSENLTRHRVVTGRSFEFIHATFGEYLVARHFKNLLVGSRVARRAVMPWQKDEEVIDDDLLTALYSYQSFAKRRQVLTFLAELPLSADNKVRILDSIPLLLQRAAWALENGRLERYAPQSSDTAKKLATYSVNLVLAFAAIEGEINISRLLDGDQHAPWPAWRRYVLLWESRLDRAEWDELCQMLQWIGTVSNGSEFKFSTDIDGEVPNDSLPLRLQELDNESPVADAPADGAADLYRQIRRADFTLEAFDRQSLDVVNHLARAVGPFAVARFTPRLPVEGVTGSHRSIEPYGVLGATFLARIAYPIAEEKYRDLKGDYQRCLDYLVASFEQARWNLVLRREVSRALLQVLRCLRRDCDILPTSIVMAFLQVAVANGPESAELQYYSEVLRICGKIIRAVGGEDGCLNLARTAFARLDVSHLIETRPASVLSLIIQVADEGVPIDDVSEYGNLANWFDMFDLVDISHSQPSLVRRVFSAAQERGLDKWVANKAVWVLPYIPDSALERFTTEHMLHILSVASSHLPRTTPSEYGSDVISKFDRWEHRLDFSRTYISKAKN